MTTNVNATNTSVTPTASTQPKFLGNGNQGPEVGKLQKQLVDLGFAVGDIDSKFGPKTEEAVKAFQTSKGIKPDGVVGPDTRAALEKAVKAVAGATEAAKPKESNQVSGEASKAAVQSEAEKAKALENYGKAAPAAPKTRLEEQQEAAKDLLAGLADDAKLGLIIANPLFAPAALAIASKAQARAIVRYETEVPQKDLSVLVAEEGAKARKEIAGLPKAYAEFGAAALGAVVESSTQAALAAYEWGASALTSVAETGSEIAETAWEGTKKGADIAWEGTKKGADIAWEGTKTGAKAWWHFQTAPVRALGWLGEKVGQGLSWFGNILSGGSKNIQDVGK